MSPTFASCRPHPRSMSPGKPPNRMTLATSSAAGSAAGEPSRVAKAPAPKRAPTQAIPASRSWHSANGKTAPLDDRGRALLVLQGLNIPDRVELTPRTDRGGFSAEDLD